MAKISKLICVLLSVIMLLSVFSVNVFAETIYTAKATVTEPAVGKKPANVKLSKDSRYEVVETNWSGNFADDGTFKAGEVYTVEYKIDLINYKDVIKYRLRLREGEEVTLNGNLAEIVWTNDIDEATLKYTFPVLTQAGVQVAEKPVKAESETIDLNKVYSVKEADLRWAQGNPQLPTELIITTQDKALSSIYPSIGNYEALCLRRVLLDYEVDDFNSDDAWAFVVPRYSVVSTDK